jgi:hypothetical protein
VAQSTRLKTIRWWPKDVHLIEREQTGGLLVKRSTVYKLWFHCRRKISNQGSDSLEDLIKFQPHLKELLTYYDKCVDVNGKETVNARASNQRRKEKKILNSIKDKMK